MSPGSPEWIHSCMFRRKGEREIAELGVSSPDTGTDTLAHIPPPARKNAGTGAHGMHLYIDHRIILKCTFIHPHTITYLYIPHTRTCLDIHRHASTDSCEHTQPTFSGAALFGAHKRKHIRDVPTQAQLVCGTSVLPVHRLTPFARNPGYAAKRPPASPRVTLEKPPADSLNSFWSPGLPPLHPTGNAPLPTRRRRTPPGAGLESAQRPQELAKAGRPWLEGRRRPQPKEPSGPVAWSPCCPGAHGRWGAQHGSPGSGRTRRGCFGDSGFAGPCALSGPTQGASRSRALRGGRAETRARDCDRLTATRTFARGVFEGPVP